MEICYHGDPGGEREATSPYVVMAAHSPSPADGQTVQRAVQDQNHQQETQRGAAQTAGGEKQTEEVVTLQLHSNATETRSAKISHISFHCQVRDAVALSQFNFLYYDTLISNR